jgi:hypothetical protein
MLHALKSGSRYRRPILSGAQLAVILLVSSCGYSDGGDDVTSARSDETTAELFIRAMLRNDPDHAARYVAEQYAALAGALSDTAHHFAAAHYREIQRTRRGPGDVLFTFRGQYRKKSKPYVQWAEWRVRLVRTNRGWGVRDYATENASSGPLKLACQLRDARLCPPPAP